MDKKHPDYGNEKIGRLFRMLFFPTLIGMVFNSALNICDGMFVGHGVGSNALAAINIVAPLFLVCTGIGLMFGIGASVVGSIRLSQNNPDGARLVMSQAFLTGIVIFGLVILASLLFPRPILYALGCSPALEQDAKDYLLWLLPGLLFLYLQCVGMMLIRLDGSPRYAMTVQIVGAVLNIFLDWLMVFPMAMGLKGAAIATSIACIVAGLMVVIYFFKFSSTLRFVPIRLGHGEAMKALRSVAYMSKIGFATFLTELAIGIMMITGNFMFMDYLGEDGVAAFSIGCYLFPIMFSISNAVAQSAQPIISFNYGAGNRDRVVGALRLSVSTAIVCGLLVFVAMWRGSWILTYLFLSPSLPAFGIAVKGLPVLALCSVFFAVNITCIGYFQSIEKAMRSTVYTLLRGIIFLVPCFVFLPRILGVDGLWLAIPVAELLTAIVIAIYFIQRRFSR